MSDEPRHQAAPLPPNEARRLEALRSYEILDTEVDAAFDDITRLASQICEAPIALISLVDENRQWFKAETGLGARETHRSLAVCAHAILQTEVFEVHDTLLDARFASSPLVRGDPHMRFYAGAPLTTPDGLSLGTVCVLDNKPRQLSDGQRQALRSLARQTMALMKLNRAVRDGERMQQHLRRLMAVAGHDLKQPLQMISMNLEIAKLKSGPGSPVIKHADAALAATAKLGRDLDDLALASSEVGNALTPERVPFALADIFDLMETTWRSAAEKKKLSLRFVPTALKVFSDPKLVATILGNLIGNAIKYTESGRVLVGCRRVGAHVRVEVLDSGIGMPPGRQQEMFKAFRKADVRSEGLGLGLTIVKDGAELLGHELKLRSVPGRGTAVGLLVPRERRDPGRQHA